MSFLFGSKKKAAKAPPAAQNKNFENKNAAIQRAKQVAGASIPTSNLPTGPTSSTQWSGRRPSGAPFTTNVSSAMGPADTSNSNTSLYPWSKRPLKYTTSHANPLPRYGAGTNAVASKEGEVYLMGGLVNATTVKGDIWMIEAGADMACYPLATTAEGPGPRVGHATLLVGNAFIAWGGDTKEKDADILDEALYLLNTSTRQWSRVYPAALRPPGRYGHSLNILGSKLYIFGGQVDGLFKNDLWAFDLNRLQDSANKWEMIMRSTDKGGLPADQTPCARTNHSVVTHEEKLYLFGGTNGSKWLNDVWSFDPHQDSWTLLQCTGYTPAPREGHSAAMVDGVMYIHGGRLEDGTDLGDLAAFRIESSRWYYFQNMGPSPSPRSGHGMSAYGKKVLLFGGEPSSALSLSESAEDLELVFVLDTTKIRYPATVEIPNAEEITSENRSSESRRGSTKEQEVQDDSPTTEVAPMVPFSDSGYASTNNGRLQGKQASQAEYRAQTAETIASEDLLDEGYIETSSIAALDDIDLEDTRTIYSDASSLPGLRDDNYISEFADNLVSKLRYEKLDGQTIQRISGILTELLKAFALKVGHNAPSQMHRDVMFFVHKYRNDIVGSFKDRFSDGEDSPVDEQDLDRDRMPLANIMGNWFQNLDDHEDNISPELNLTEMDRAKADDIFDDELYEDEDEEDDLPEPHAYQDFIFGSAAYEWLLASLHKEFLLAPADPNIMEIVKREILASLPSSHKISRRKSPDAFNIMFEIDWDPLLFVKEQGYEEEVGEVIETTITLTAGSAGHVQALTCGQYLRQTWPSLGEHTLRTVKDIVRGEPGSKHTCNLPDGTKLTGWIDAPYFKFEVSGTAPSVAEMGEQLAWLGSALRSSPYGSGVAYCTPSVTTRKNSTGELILSTVSGTPPSLQILCSMGFAMEQRDLPIEPANGQCWHNLFRNPVIVQGFPIARRPGSDAGLEIPLNIIAGLARTKQVDTFDGKTFIKGFSAMLIPTKLSEDILTWHLLYNKDGSRISYLDSIAAHASHIGISFLENARHIVGWCSEVKSFAGAVDAEYEVRRSRLPGPHADCVLEKVAISGGQFVTGGASFCIGVKDTPIHVSQNDYVSKLQWISKKFVVMWDEEDKRGWLVNGTSALLHLLRASLEYNRTDKFNSAFLFKPDEFEDASKTHTTDAAIEVLMNNRNMKLKLYPGKGEMFDEVTRRKGAEIDEAAKEKRTFIRIEDRVEHFYNVLEKIIDNQIKAAGRGGMKMKLRARKHLEGWDFKDLATQRDPFYPHVATLDAFGKGWVDFTRAIQAITLFGRGFGDIFQPADSGSFCKTWTKVPVNKYYLAACISDLQEIIEENGDPDANPMKISDGLVWHNVGRTFESCRCGEGKGSKARHSDFAQILFPSSLSFRLPKTNAVQLENHGAVIFGHNSFFKWYWNDIGDPEKGDIPEPPEEAEAFNDSAIGPSIGSTTEESSGLAKTDLGSQRSSQKIAREPLPGISSEETGDKPQIILTNRDESSESFGRDIRLGKQVNPLKTRMFKLKKLVQRSSKAQA